uniref:Uncharacterized protein n=2 Tax=Oryza brachyantha TaxID=4533 RepID=J3N6U0_ORYBR
MDCITCVCSHPDLPILLTGSNDETVRVWNSGILLPSSLRVYWTLSTEKLQL